MHSLSYWARCGVGPKQGVLIFPGGQGSFHLGEPITAGWAFQHEKDAIGVAWLIPASGKWRAEGRGVFTDSYVTPDEAVAAFREKYKEVQLHDSRMRTDAEYSLTFRLRNHDWWYMMSDDHSVWQKGEAAWAELIKAFKLVPYQRAVVLWEQYAPKEFPTPPETK